ncbi:MAG TPA: hypothetical protein VKA18_14750 [Alphaproteobacteria bacterium]|nr:hypothetical protein [Alphaproteobacteria bacterium]
MSRILFAVSLEFFLLRLPEYDWREGRLRLSEWYERMTARASFRSTAP